jgi:hypothetical protein
MRLYLDDDSVARVIVNALRGAGYDVQLPVEVGLRGEHDTVHLTHAIRDSRALLSRNYDDFQEIHELVSISGGAHRGILIVREDGDLKRDMKASQIVRAIEKIILSGISIENDIVVLNHWR